MLTDFTSVMVGKDVGIETCGRGVGAGSTAFPLVADTFACPWDWVFSVIIPPIISPPARTTNTAKGKSFNLSLDLSVIAGDVAVMLAGWAIFSSDGLRS